MINTAIDTYIPTNSSTDSLFSLIILASDSSSFLVIASTMSSSLRSGSVSDNNFRLNFDELRWVMEIKNTLEEVLEEEGREFIVSIFNVPKLLMICDPDSYVPQQVAIGPCHYWRPELYEMQRYKLAAARGFRKQLHNHKLEDLVHELTKFEPR